MTTKKKLRTAMSKAELITELQNADRLVRKLEKELAKKQPELISVVREGAEHVTPKPPAFPWST